MSVYHLKCAEFAGADTLRDINFANFANNKKKKLQNFVTSMVFY